MRNQSYATKSNASTSRAAYFDPGFQRVVIDPSPGVAVAIGLLRSVCAFGPLFQRAPTDPGGAGVWVAALLAALFTDAVTLLCGFGSIFQRPPIDPSSGIGVLPVGLVAELGVVAKSACAFGPVFQRVATEPSAVVDADPVEFVATTTVVRARRSVLSGFVGDLRSVVDQAYTAIEMRIIATISFIGGDHFCSSNQTATAETSTSECTAIPRIPPVGWRLREAEIAQPFRDFTFPIPAQPPQHLNVSRSQHVTVLCNLVTL
jgi:hypothetical protein